MKPSKRYLARLKGHARDRAAIRRIEVRKQAEYERELARTQPKAPTHRAPRGARAPAHRVHSVVVNEHLSDALATLLGHWIHEGVATLEAVSNGLVVYETRMH